MISVAASYESSKQWNHSSTESTSLQIRNLSCICVTDWIPTQHNIWANSACLCYHQHWAAEIMLYCGGQRGECGLSAVHFRFCPGTDLHLTQLLKHQHLALVISQLGHKWQRAIDTLWWLVSTVCIRGWCETSGPMSSWETAPGPRQPVSLPGAEQHRGSRWWREQRWAPRLPAAERWRRGRPGDRGRPASEARGLTWSSPLGDTDKRRWFLYLGNMIPVCITVFPWCKLSSIWMDFGVPLFLCNMILRMRVESCYSLFTSVETPAEEFIHYLREMAKPWFIMCALN